MYFLHCFQKNYRSTDKKSIIKRKYLQSVLPLSYYTNLFKNIMIHSLICVFVNNVNKGGNCLYDSTNSLLFITFIK